MEDCVGSDSWESSCNAGDCNPGLIPWRREWLPTPIILPGEFHEQRSLAGYSPWVTKSQTWLSKLHFYSMEYYSNIERMNWSTKQKQTHRHRKQTSSCQEGRGWGREGLTGNSEIAGCKLLYIEWVNNQVLLYGTRNYIQYPVISHNGKEYEKEYVYV